VSPPVISVVIPVSDKAPHIGAALESVLAQDYAPHEILVIDDASRDGSRTVVEGYPDPRIRLLSRTERGPGGYAARNLGIGEARGDWIAFLDADDLWYPQHLRVLSGLIATAAPDVVCVFSGWERLWRDGRRQRDVFSASRDRRLGNGTRL
jgi:glycosyltransferase involved in cell wall biosynthesis